MRRRDFLTLLSGAAAAWPIAARAQQAASPLVGFLMQGGQPGRGAQAIQPELFAALLRGLAEAGYVEGRNVAIEYRWANNETNRLPELAADLVRRRVSVIAAPGSTPAALAAKAATSTIPIAFSMGRDPVQLGLVASLARPGGNLTGFTEMNTEVGPKRVSLLHTLVPQAARFAMIVDPKVAGAEDSVREVQGAAATIGRSVEILNVSTNEEIDAAFAMLVQKRVDALLVTGGSLVYTARVQVSVLAARHAIPAIYWDRAFPDAGGLMSYGSSVAESFRQVGIYTGRILKGEKPADMPVMQPTTFEFVFNLKTAKALGLDVPPTLLAIADEVIE
jgi:putative ABC transport system substrate-binding protein